jgi:hypothetical protein
MPNLHRHTGACQHPVNLMIRCNAVMLAHASIQSNDDRPKGGL